MRHEPTASEAKLFEAIRSGKLGVSFRRQVPLAGRFIADFYAAEVRLVVEVDGGYHARRSDADARRDRALEKLGYRVLRLGEATSRALLKFGGGPSDFYATARAGASTFFVGFDV